MRSPRDGTRYHFFPHQFFIIDMKIGGECASETFQMRLYPFNIGTPEIESISLYH